MSAPGVSVCGMIVSATAASRRIRGGSRKTLARGAGLANASAGKAAAPSSKAIRPSMARRSISKMWLIASLLHAARVSPAG